jgi:8-oxo-dGTP pyrophosphatase MutT (NUDIX family)
VEYHLPPAFAERARAFAESGGVPVEPRLASTVVLMREPFEAYLIRRVATMAFAASMYVFPGGGVDPRDSAVTTTDPWGDRLGRDEPTARAIVCAAVREVFEESGVLLAGPDADSVIEDVSGPEWEAARLALIARELGFAEFLASRNLILRSDLLVPWSRWITPDFEPRRFDTYFFIAALPTGQRTRDVGGEADATAWCTPADATDGRFTMLPPTHVTLTELAARKTIDEVFAAERNAVDPVLPSF